MLQHERLINDPGGTLRDIWNDTGWRFVVIAAALVFILETVAELVGLVESSAWWFALTLTIVWIARSLVSRPLRGRLTDTPNMTVVLAVIGLTSMQGIFSYTTVGATFSAEPIFWPYSLIMIGTLVAARLAAPYAARPLNIWLLAYAFLVFWLHVVMWTSELSFIDPPFSWGLAIMGLALLARWIAGRGFDGPVLSPLNVTVALTIFLQWWLEYGVNKSGSAPTRGATRRSTGPGCWPPSASRWAFACSRPHLHPAATNNREPSCRAPSASANGGGDCGAVFVRRVRRDRAAASDEDAAGADGGGFAGLGADLVGAQVAETGAADAAHDGLVGLTPDVGEAGVGLVAVVPVDRGDG